jgi:hypothetical protein
MHDRIGAVERSAACTALPSRPGARRSVLDRPDVRPIG